jgi:hypothetical protein
LRNRLAADKFDHEIASHLDIAIHVAKWRDGHGQIVAAVAVALATLSLVVLVGRAS